MGMAILYRHKTYTFIIEQMLFQINKPENDDEGCTSNHKDCTFGNPVHMKRIDYLLYRNNAGMNMCLAWLLLLRHESNCSELRGNRSQ